MIAEPGQADGLGQLSPVANQGLSEESPEVAARAVLDAESEQGASHADQVLQPVIAWRLRRVLAQPAQGVQRALIVLGRTVDGPQDMLVTGYEAGAVHARHKVQGTVGVVTGGIDEQTSFPLEPPPELGIWERLEQADHGLGNGGGANEVDLPLEDVG